VGPRAGLDSVAKRKESLHFPCRESNPGRPARSLVTLVILELGCIWAETANDQT